MNNDRLRYLKWSGWSGLLASAAFLTTVLVSNLVTSGTEPPAGPSDMVRYFSDISENPAGFVAYGTAGIVLSILYIPMSFGVYRMLQRTTIAWFGTAAVVIGLGILLPAYVTNILLANGLAPAAAEVGEAGNAPLFVVYEFASSAAAVFFTVGSILTLAIGPGLWAVEALKSRVLSTWLAWTGVVVGVSGLVWFVWFVSSPLVLIALIVNGLASLILFTGLSATLVSTASGQRPVADTSDAADT